MSIAGVLCSSLSHLANTQSKVAARTADFKKLGEDLQSGNLAAAQDDFTSLAKSNNTTTANSTNAVVGLKKAFSDLQTSLNSGDISGAQKAYAAVQQDFQTLGSQIHHKHTHRPAPDAAPAQSSGSANDPASSAAALIDMLTGITNSTAASAYNTNDLQTMMGVSPLLNAAA